MHAQDEREGLALVRGPLMRQSVITAAWAANGWHGYRRGGSETAVPYPGQLVYNLSRCAASLPPNSCCSASALGHPCQRLVSRGMLRLGSSVLGCTVSNRVAAYGGLLTLLPGKPCC